MFIWQIELWLSYRGYQWHNKFYLLSQLQVTSLWNWQHLFPNWNHCFQLYSSWGTLHLNHRILILYLYHFCHLQTPTCIYIQSVFFLKFTNHVSTWSVTCKHVGRIFWTVKVRNILSVTSDHCIKFSYINFHAVSIYRTISFSNWNFIYMPHILHEFSMSVR